jgi:hypothetical protein
VAFFSEDVVTVETEHHSALASQHVNNINLRREFFYATRHQVFELLRSTVGNVVALNAVADAEEYR